MSAPPQPTAAPASANHSQDGPAAAHPAGVPSTTGPLALWLVLQLAAMLLVVLRVPLAAKYPEPAEELAAYWLSGTQVVAGALMFPYLLRDRRSAAQVIASAWPFLLAAGYLAGATATEMLWPAMSVTAWLATLALWTPLLRTDRARATGVAVAALLTLGGGALRYLRLEFAAGREPGSFPFESASPLLSTLATLEGSTAPAGWVLMGMFALFGGVARAVNSAKPRVRSIPAARPAA